MLNALCSVRPQYIYYEIHIKGYTYYLIAKMSSSNNNSLSCSVCNKVYKSRGALLKHQSKCSAHSENITSNIIEPTRPPLSAPVSPSSNITNDIQYDDDTQYDARREFKEQIHALMSSKHPPPSEPVVNENIVVNTTALDCLMKAFVTELFAYQHKQIQSLLDHNAKLVEENKMLVSVLRTIVLIKHNNGSLGDFDTSSNDD